jgi:hypothetical protein
MSPSDGHAMFELQLELHSRARGRRPNVSVDEVIEVHQLLAQHAGDLKSLIASI